METGFDIKHTLQSWRLASGEEVRDREVSHLHANVKELLAEVCSKIQTQGKDVLIEEVDLARPVGLNMRVKTTDTDEIVFAQRPNREGLTRFVKNRQPEMCSIVRIVLKKSSKFDGYEISTAFIGTAATLEPWHKDATLECTEFWNKEAMIWGSEPVIEGTETTECPWK
jgi:hypothetical protein